MSDPPHKLSRRRFCTAMVAAAARASQDRRARVELAYAFALDKRRSC